MELHILQAISLPPIVHDALVVVGIGIALLAGVAFLSVGVLLPGLLGSTNGNFGNPRNGYLEFGPAAAPVISDPAPPRAMDMGADPEAAHGGPVRIWSYAAGSAVLHPAPVVLKASR